MNASTLQPGNRPLFINFDLHTDGDNDFKKELIALMIENMRELIWAQNRSHQQNDHSFFLKACHKMKSTLAMLDDKELLQVVHELSDPILNLDGQKPERVKRFVTLCEGIIKSLDKEQA
jgi:HPt (histidine-containing phosphotransfer) domain-containing protein